MTLEAEQKAERRDIKSMPALTIGTDELKKIIREAFIEVLTERRDLIEDAVLEAIEDIGLGIAMKEGRTGEYVENRKFLKRLESKIQRAK